MARCTLILAATSLAVANAFMAPAHSGLALRSHRAASAVQPMRRSKAPQAGVSMQVEHLAEQATLLAAYPEGFVNGMTSYFNLCESACASRAAAASRLWRAAAAACCAARSKTRQVAHARTTARS